MRPNKSSSQNYPNSFLQNTKVRERVVVAVWLTREASFAGDPFDFAHGRLFERHEESLRSASGVCKGQLESRPGASKTDAATTWAGPFKRLKLSTLKIDIAETKSGKSASSACLFLRGRGLTS